jgi:hypothetical protein
MRAARIGVDIISADGACAGDPRHTAEVFRSRLFHVGRTLSGSQAGKSRRRSGALGLVSRLRMCTAPFIESAGGLPRLRWKSRYRCSNGWPKCQAATRVNRSSVCVINQPIILAGRSKKIKRCHKIKRPELSPGADKHVRYFLSCIRPDVKSKSRENYFGNMRCSSTRLNLQPAPPAAVAETPLPPRRTRLPRCGGRSSRRAPHNRAIPR